MYGTTETAVIAGLWFVGFPLVGWLLIRADRWSRRG